jgi:hypothetical protein
MTDAKKVRAKADGYYAGAVQHPGDTFALVDPSHFSETWMEEIPEGQSTIDDQDRKDALASNAGVVGIARVLEVDGVAKTPEQVIADEFADKQPTPNKVKPREGPERVVSQGVSVEVPRGYKPAPNPTEAQMRTGVSVREMQRANLMSEHAVAEREADIASEQRRKDSKAKK